MATIEMTSSDVHGVISQADHVSIFSRPARRLRTARWDLDGWFHDVCWMACLDALTMRLNGFIADAPTRAQTRRRPTSPV